MLFPFFLLSILASAALVAAQTTGDSFCTSSVCVSAVKSAFNVTYTLSRAPKSQKSRPGFGWISIGFGHTMSNSQMIIAWPNSDNSITLSQRSSKGQVEPTIASSPASIATLDKSRSLVNSSSSTITFSLTDTSTAAVIPIIWAYGDTSPSSSSASASILQHRDFGASSLDLTKALGAGAGTRTGTATPISKTSSSAPYTQFQKVLIAHVAVGGIGAMVFIPLGILIARLLRIIWPRWIVTHWVIHVVTSLPAISVAFGLAIWATDTTFGPGADHFFSGHRKLGLGLLVLMWIQVIFGSAIHWIPASHRSRPVFKGKSIQNILHPLLGVIILVVGWATCWSGFDEWEQWSRLGEIPKGVKIAWGVLLLVFGLAYVGGLALLPRQFNPRLVDRRDTKEEYPLREREGFSSAP